MFQIVTARKRSNWRLAEMGGKMSKTLKNRWISAFICLVWATSVPSINAQEQTKSSQNELPRIFVVGTCMGPIPYSVIVVDAPGEVDTDKLQSLVDDALQRVNQSMSTYLPDSDVSRFNDSPSEDWISVDSETALVVQRALEISKQFDGAFDITVGPAVDLWKFGPDKDRFQVPTDDAIDSVKQIVGYKLVQVRTEPPALRKSHPKVRIDLSAIAKGFAVDQVAERLLKLNCDNFMIEVGGEVRCQGIRHTGKPWRVGIRKPDEITSVPDVVVELSNQCMATSGDYENFHRVGKKRYSHTIDPNSCRPVEHFMASASIVANDCMTADAMATAAMVLGRQRAKSLLQKSGMEFFLVERESAFGSDFTKVSSATFPVANRPISELNTVSATTGGPVNNFFPVFIASAVIFGLVILAMAVGAIVNNKPVRGSCGGIAVVMNEDGEASCGICSKPTTDCVEQSLET